MAPAMPEPNAMIPADDVVVGSAIFVTCVANVEHKNCCQPAQKQHRNTPGLGA
jgi:hypothetical protein